MNWLDLFASLLSKQQGQNWRGPFMRVHKSEKRREVTLQGFCWPFACCHSPSWHHFSTKARKLLWSPFDFLLGVPVFYLVLSRPIKNDTSPLAHWSHSRIKDSPYSLHHSAPDSQNLQQLEILTEVFSAQIPSEGAVIRPQDAHHLPEQTQKTTVWCSMELTVPRQMAVTWLTSLRKCRENEVRPRTPARPRDRKGVIFACVAKNGNLISESRKPPFPSNRFQWASKWLAVTYPQSKSQAITDCHNGQPRRLAKNENRRDSFLIFCLIERHIKILWQKWKACPWKRIIVSNFHCTQCSVKRYKILLPWEKGLWNAFPLLRFAQPSLSRSRIKMVHTWGPGPPSYV